MKKIGVVVAIEIDALLSKYGTPCETIYTHGRTVSVYKNEDFELYAVDTGAGEIAAASGTQLLISEFGVDMIMNFGVVGALTEEMTTAELCVVEKVVHYDFETSGWYNLARGQYPGQDSAYVCPTPELVQKAMEVYPKLRKVSCASADKFVSEAADKKRLHEEFNADICEMESAGILLTCLRCEIPCLFIKAVSDSLTGGGAEFMSELGRVSEICFDALDEIIREIDL